VSLHQPSQGSLQNHKPRHMTTQITTAYPLAPKPQSGRPNSPTATPLPSLASRQVSDEPLGLTPPEFPPISTQRHRNSQLTSLTPIPPQTASASVHEAWDMARSSGSDLISGMHSCWATGRIIAVLCRTVLRCGSTWCIVLGLTCISDAPMGTPHTCARTATRLCNAALGSECERD
jgi:hypothetical protein